MTPGPGKGVEGAPQHGFFRLVEHQAIVDKAMTALNVIDIRAGVAAPYRLR